MTKLIRGRREDGSADAIFAAIMFPIIVVFGLGLFITYLFRVTIEQPLPGVVSSYTQMYAAYGSNNIPKYGWVEIDGEIQRTVSGALKRAMVATGRVADNDPSNVSVTCGPLGPDGSIVPQSGSIPANTAVSCNVEVLVRAWPYRSILPGGVPEFLLGENWSGSATAYTDRGSNANIQ